MEIEEINIENTKTKIGIITLELQEANALLTTMSRLISEPLQFTTDVREKYYTAIDILETVLKPKNKAWTETYKVYIKEHELIEKPNGEIEPTEENAEEIYNLKKLYEEYFIKDVKIDLSKLSSFSIDDFLGFGKKQMPITTDYRLIRKYLFAKK